MSKILYKEISPDKLLSDFVKRFWAVSNSSEENQYCTILPDGYFDIIVTVTDNKLNNVSLTGIYTTDFEVVIPAKTAFFGVSFLPLATDYILDQSLSILHNKHQNLPLHFLGFENANFANFQLWTEELSLQFISKIIDGKVVDERKQKLFNLLFQTNGSLTIQEIANQIFWTPRQINRYFNEIFGLSLKTYCNVLKCKQSFDDIKKGELFPQQNYTDQPHFIREVKKHTGTTPKVLAKNKNDRFIQFSTRPT
ncbi:AraC family transcriptional regulator [Flavobacterium plurextorum]|uniref:helix-turn-helix domain-containing protein n=1 Tax=Flavobacterium TaxID=237 RepID=UPI00214DA042|nr:MULTISPECIES: AraC family transcriptional regulator [Flavobacterium]UUW08419.1 AraC family transcriptional regulator [Flavobacterium plurextorum]